MNSKPITIRATYRIVTPMFCAGANQQSAELRLASFKGALRFWWRTLMAAKFGVDIDALYKAEASLFGSSDRDFGQSKVRMRLTDQNLAASIESGTILENGRLKGAHYLGYGVMEAYDGKNTKAGRLTRPMIPGGQFTVAVRVMRAKPNELEQLRNALVLLGTLGGLGSKSRKGFGSLNLTQLTISEEVFQVADRPEDRLKACIERLSTELPDWTAWGPDARVVYFESTDEPLAVLNRCGQMLSDYRLWQGEGRSNFSDDHDLVFNYLRNGTEATAPPERIAFGLPHNYFFRSLSDRSQGLNVKAEITPTNHSSGRERSRRASPLFLHIEESCDGRTRAILSFLPAKFLSDPQTLLLSDTSSRGKSNRKKQRSLKLDIPAETLSMPVHKFLDSICANQSLNAQEVTLG